MEENTIGVTIQHFPSIYGMTIKIIDRFPQTILRDLDHWICDLRTGHSAREGCTRVSIHYVHEQFQSSLSLFEYIFDALLAVEFARILDHDSGDQKLEQYFGDESFLHVLFDERYFVGSDEDVVAQIFDHLFFACLVLDQLADFLHVHRHARTHPQFLPLALFEELFYGAQTCRVAEIVGYHHRRVQRLKIKQ